MQIKDLILQLQKDYQPEDHVAIHLWSKDDVLKQAEEMEVKITLQDANIILDQVNQNIDSELGITWDTIQDSIRSHIEGENNE